MGSYAESAIVWEELVKISVIMSVYNTKEDYLREAIESILNQSFPDYEFIIVNDGSRDDIKNIIRSYQDHRIVFIDNETNIGLTKSLNKALCVAQGKYIARMDADDISYKHRLEKQYKYMEKHREIDILGAWIYDGKHVEKTDGRISSECRKVRMLFKNAGIMHPTAFIRREFLIEHSIIYDEAIEKAQDYKLWVECLSKGGRISVFPEVLLYYRRHAGQITEDKNGEQRKFQKIIQESLIKEIYPEISERELYLFCNKEEQVQNAEEFIGLCKKIEDKNIYNKKYDAHILKYELKDIYIKYDKSEIFDIGYWWYRIKRYIAKSGII